MKQLVEQGKVRYLGLSEAKSATLRRAPPSIQLLPRCRRNIRFGLATWKEKLLAACRELGVGFVAYSPLGRGFLTGAFSELEQIWRTVISAKTIRAFRARISSGTSGKLVDGIKKLAEEKGCTTAQLAPGLGAGTGRGTIVPIVKGPSWRSYPNENLAALEVCADTGRSCPRLDPGGAARRDRRAALRSGRDTAPSGLRDGIGCLLRQSWAADRSTGGPSQIDVPVEDWRTAR